MHLNKIKKIFLIFFCAVFLFTSVVFLFGESMKRTIIEESFYENLVEEVDIRSLIIKGFLLDSPKIEKLEHENKKITFYAEKAFMETFSREYVNEKIILAINDILPLLRKEKNELQEEIDFTEKKDIFKKNILSEIGDDFPAKIVLKENLTDIIPDKIVLNDLLDNPNIVATILSFQGFYSYFEIFSYFILIFLLILIIFLAGFSLSMKIIGTTMTVSGIIFLLSLLSFKNLIYNINEDIINLTIRDDILIVTNLFISKVSSLPITYSFIGLIVLMAGVFVGFKEKKDKEYQETA